MDDRPTAEVPWQGTASRVVGNNIYINRGSREGVTVNHVFWVGADDIIRDPDTGEVLDETVNGVVVTVKEKSSPFAM